MCRDLSLKYIYPDRGHKCLGLLVGHLVSPSALVASALVRAEREQTSAGAGQSN